MLDFPPTTRNAVLKRLMTCILLVSAILLGSISASDARADNRVTIFAAVSLKTALDATAIAWTEKTGTPTRVAYGSSAALARQIEQGAPADIFFSANSLWMEYLVEKNLIVLGSDRKLFGNSLVLIAPTGDPSVGAVRSLSDILAALKGGRLALANTLAVPAGIYARQALTTLGLWNELQPHVAETQHVRAALALVARKEAPLGMVYATDANAEPLVQILAEIPASSHDPIVYPAGLLRSSKQPEAITFLDFLTSDAGQKYFLAQGFARLQ
jgi:molybdate transport system substrate-binding protein